MPVAFWNFPLMTNIKEVSPRPILMVAGENAHSRYYSEDAYKAAVEPKELLIIPEADTMNTTIPKIALGAWAWGAGAAGGDQVFGNHLGDETGVHTLREWEKEME